MAMLAEDEEGSRWDRRWDNTVSKEFKVDLTPLAAKLIRVCVIQRLQQLIPKCRTHQRHGKRRIMRGDDVLLAMGVRKGRGLSNIGAATNKTSSSKNEAASSSRDPNQAANHDDVIRYVLDPMYQSLTPTLPKDKRRILGVLAKLVRDPEAVDEHISRTLTVFQFIFSRQKASIADLFHVTIPILLGKRPIPAAMRQRCARIITMTSDESAHEVLANVMGTALHQIRGSTVSYEVIRGALWGLAHHPTRIVEFHEPIAETLKLCWDYFTEQKDGVAARDILDAMWTILRKERMASLTWKVPHEEITERASILGDDEPQRRKRRIKTRKMASQLPGGLGGPGPSGLPGPMSGDKRPGGFGLPGPMGFTGPDLKKVKRENDQDVEVSDPEIAFQYISSPVARIARESHPPEMLGRADPFLRLLL